MRLPIISEEQAVGQGVAPQASMAQFAQVGSAGQALGMQVSHDAQRVSTQFFALEREKERLAGQTEAVDIFTNVSRKAEDAYLQLRTDPKTSWKTLPTDYQKEFDRIAGEESGAATSASAQQALRPLLQRLKIETTRKAQHDANGLFLDNERATLNTALSEWSVAAANARTPQERQFYEDFAKWLVTSKKRVLQNPEQDAQKIMAHFGEGINIESAKQVIRADPERFDRLAWEDKITSAKLDVLQNAANAAVERREKKVQQVTAAAADAATKDINDAIESKSWGRARELLSENRRTLKGEKYEHFLDRITKQSEVVKDDEATVRRLNQSVYRISAPIRQGESDIDAAERAGLIKPDTARTYRSHLESKANRFQDKALAESHRDQEKVERSILRAIPATGVFGATVVEAAQIQDLAIRELDRQVKAGESPDAWWERRRAGFLSRATEAGATRAAELQRSLLYKTVTDTLANRQILDQRDPTGRLYYEQLNQARQHEELTLEIERLRQANNPTKPPTPTTPSTPPADKPQTAGPGGGAPSSKRKLQKAEP